MVLLSIYLNLKQLIDENSFEKTSSENAFYFNTLYNQRYFFKEFKDIQLKVKNYENEINGFSYENILIDDDFIKKFI